jgi:hypothetical protein
MYCKHSVAIDVPNLRGDGAVASLRIEGVRYECDDKDLCWAVDLDTRSPPDALLLVKALCQIESAVPRNCATVMRGIDRHCNVLPAKPERRTYCSAELIQQQRSQWATLTKGQLKAYDPTSGALYHEYSNMAVFLVRQAAWLAHGFRRPIRPHRAQPCTSELLVLV